MIVPAWVRVGQVELDDRICWDWRGFRPTVDEAQDVALFTHLLVPQGEDA